MDPFIYLSYRGEEPEALAVLRRLEADGFPVRNDRSPVPDGAALERCAEQLAHCSAFVSLITEEYKDSDWCVNDLVIAQEKDIPILPIVLSASVPARLLLIIVTMRQIHRSAYDDEDAFFREIYASRALAASSPAPEAHSSIGAFTSSSRETSRPFSRISAARYAAQHAPSSCLPVPSADSIMASASGCHSDSSVRSR